MKIKISLLFILLFAALAFSQTYSGRAYSMKKTTDPLAFQCKIKKADSTLEVFYIGRNGSYQETAAKNLFRKCIKSGTGRILVVNIDEDQFYTSIDVRANNAGTGSFMVSGDTLGYIKTGYKTHFYISALDTGGTIDIFPNSIGSLKPRNHQLACHDKNSLGWELVEAIFDADEIPINEQDWIYMNLSDKESGPPQSFVAEYSEINVDE